jgi:hypothetical protein
LLLVVATLAPAMAACSHLTRILGTTDAPAETASAAIVAQVCETFQPIRYSRNDTATTQQQVREHNAAWDELCR